MKQKCIQCESLYETKPSYNSKYCSNSCQLQYQYEEYISAWKAGFVDGSIGIKSAGVVSKHLRRYLDEKFNNSCCECGITVWNGKSITLEVEHCDGDSSNHVEDNLKLLCPNCHSQTDTYRAKNKGKGRLKRY